MDDKLKTTRETYDDIAEEWHVQHQEDTWWQEGTNHFISLFKLGSSILDAGCGAGTKSKYLLARGLAVRGIDFSKGMIEIAARENPSGTFEVLDMSDAASLAREFDGIFAQASLLHIPKSQIVAVLKALSSRLRSGGYFYVAVKEKRDGQVEEEMKTENDIGRPYDRFFSYYFPEELKGFFGEAGLAVVFEDVRKNGNTR